MDEGSCFATLKFARLRYPALAFIAQLRCVHENSYSIETFDLIALIPQVLARYQSY